MTTDARPGSPDFEAVRARAEGVAARVAGLDGTALLEPLIRAEFLGKIALVSSFGTESAVLLALAAEIDPAIPVLFIDTGAHFGETRRYRDRLIARLGLTGVRTLVPDPEELGAADPVGLLFQRDPDACCAVRKVLPLERALGSFDAWISGRKHYHGTGRADLPVIEVDRRWIKINPLVAWPRERLSAEFERRALPAHPLEAEGYLSIGCMPCSQRTAPDGDLRAGRWAGHDKTECGIHRGPAA